MSSEWNSCIGLSISGSSHGECIKAILSGMPSGEKVDIIELQQLMDRRAPGRSGTSQRKEPDIPEFISGITDGITDGNPIEIIIRNRDARSSDYDGLKYIPRPGHADYPAYVKSGGAADMRGGGEFSGRMTAPMCAAGGIVLQILKRRGIEIHAGLEGPYTAPPERDSIGGLVKCTVTGLPVGLGGAMFDGIDGKIAHLIFSIPAVKGIEFGAGFRAATMLGSENNDSYSIEGGKVAIHGNNAGGVLGGMTSGAPLEFRTAFKPAPSIAKPQSSVNLKTMENVTLEIKGRHDPCVALRALPVVEAVTALAIYDCIRESEPELGSMRSKLDSVDRQLMRILSHRFELTDGIGRIKHENKLPVSNIEREQQIIDTIPLNTENSESAPEIEALYRKLFELSKQRQEKLWNTDL